MAYEHKPNSGTLFPNDRKEKETHPDFKGSCKIDGVDYWVSGWKNERDGKHSLGMKFEPQEQQREESPQEDRFEPNPFG